MKVRIPFLIPLATAFAANVVSPFAMPNNACLNRQMSDSIVGLVPETRTVVVGSRYRAGGLKKLLLGRDYRELWTTAVDVPVLDLDHVGGGLTPLRTGGYGQSVTLHFRGADGRRYVVRSVDKNASRRLFDDFRGTFVESVVQDQVSALHPFGALVVDGLLEATGVLHAPHTLVAIPDHPRLGAFREEYAGMVGMLVEHPNEGPDDAPGFAGSTLIIGSKKFFELLHESPCDQVDARAFLKARLLDLVVGDKDRHARQWRWASFANGACRVWKPIPEDRDQAFIDFDGLLMALTRIVRPQQIGFGPGYPNITGLTFNGWEVDRELLAELERPVWDSLVGVVQRQLSDQVIDRAVHRLPPDPYALNGASLAAALKARRDRLDEAATDYYRLITGYVDVVATNRAEVATIEHLADGAVHVRLSAQVEAVRGTHGEPYFQRTFHPHETKEIRLYLLDGADRATVEGGQGKIVVRLVGGDGRDQFLNRSGAGSRLTRFYDASGDGHFVRGRGARLDRKPFERPPSNDPAHQYALDWGGRRIFSPFVSVSPDNGLFFGAVAVFERYGFRKVPYAARHVFSGGFATGSTEGRLAYSGRYRHIGPSIDGMLRVQWSGIEANRFHGFGNDTRVGTSTAFFTVEQRQFSVEPQLAIVRGDRPTGEAQTDPSVAQTHTAAFEFRFGPVLKLVDTDSTENADRFIATAPPYGFGFFAQAGFQAGIEFDTRDIPGHAKRGVHLEIAGSVYPEMLDVASTFGTVHGSASTYLTARVPTNPTLALRVGGKKVWGRFPYHEAAYLGGARNLRGFRDERFAGDASVYGNAELRLSLARLRILVPGRLGVFGLSDVGRAFFDGDGDDADTWHTGLGGGVWFSFFKARHTLSIAVANGDDLTGVYVRAGFQY